MKLNVSKRLIDGIKVLLVLNGIALCFPLAIFSFIIIGCFILGLFIVKVMYLIEFFKGTLL